MRCGLSLRFRKRNFPRVAPALEEMSPPSKTRDSVEERASTVGACRRAMAELAASLNASAWTSSGRREPERIWDAVLALAGVAAKIRE
jgi:hypothetical protein